VIRNRGPPKGSKAIRGARETASLILSGSHLRLRNTLTNSERSLYY
jgi:hypothetical protein